MIVTKYGKPVEVEMLPLLSELDGYTPIDITNDVTVLITKDGGAWEKLDTIPFYRVSPFGTKMIVSLSGEDTTGKIMFILVSQEGAFNSVSQPIATMGEAIIAFNEDIER